MHLLNVADRKLLVGSGYRNITKREGGVLAGGLQEANAETSAKVSQ